ncbi:MAG: glycosyltransferase [Myxococcota bacterium]
MTAALVLLLFLTAYSYFVYPVILMMLPRRSERREPFNAPPSMSIIIAVRNAQDVIGRKLENTLSLERPTTDIEIVVASDGSDDGTDDVVEQFADRGVALLRCPAGGKESAQKAAIAVATGDVLVFSDVGTEIPRDALVHLLQEFTDAGVGAVSSEDRMIREDGTVSGEGAYVRYEMALRRLESRVRGVIGLSGSFFAARKEVCESWDTKSPSDFNTAVNCARKGYVAISSPRVLGLYRDVKGRQEYGRKVRTVLRGITAVARNTDVLNPFRFGLFAFQMISHKIMRWAVPWLLIGTALLSVSMWSTSPFARLVVVGQSLFYGIVILGSLVPALQKSTLIRIPVFFVQVNVGIAHATCNFLMGKRIVAWTPSKR